MATIRFKRGNKKDLPKYAQEGEPLFCLDTLELYIGRGDKKSTRRIGIIDPEGFESIHKYYRGYISKLYNIKGDYIVKDSFTQEGYKIMYAIHVGSTKDLPEHAEKGTLYFCDETCYLYKGMGKNEGLKIVRKVSLLSKIKEFFKNSYYRIKNIKEKMRRKYGI